MKRPLPDRPPQRAIAIVCFALLFGAWIVDLLTPQLFVAAILLNGPIALSGLALNTRLTTTLIVLAEIANIVAGYVNGVQAHYHWDTIAIGDRLLSAASFLLVGYLTIRAQEYAQDAGSATERARIFASEKALQHALEAVRATLNVELVQRSITREALSLTQAGEAMLVIRGSQLQLPDVYDIKRDSRDVAFERRSIDPPLASIVQRTIDNAGVTVAGQDDPVARMVLDQHGATQLASVRVARGDATAVLLVFGEEAFPRGIERQLQSFADGSSVALNQAWLFTQLGYRNEQIAAQKDELERRNRVIRDIVYALAHDLRTPLSAADVTMQQALEGAYGPLPERYQSILRTTLASNADVRRLVETLLLVARFESGESSTLRDEIDVARAAERVFQELAPLAGVKGIQLHFDDAGDGIVIGDESELRRAMSNLVANAIEATPAGASVTLRTSAKDDSVAVRVEDEGYGVAPEQRERLFQRFAAGSRRFGAGTGLGLYIVRLIAEKFGGRAEYDPRDPRGSVFSMILPATKVTVPSE